MEVQISKIYVSGLSVTWLKTRRIVDLESTYNSSDFGGGSAGRIKMFVTSNPCTQVTHTVVLSAVVSCVCEFTLLFHVVLHLVSVVHAFCFTLVIYWTAIARKPWESKICNNRSLCSWQERCFFCKVNPEIRDPTHAVSVNAILVGQE